MEDQALFQRVLQIVAAVGRAQSWRLDRPEQLRYASRVITLIGERSLSDAQISSLLINYHQDHQLAEAMRDPKSGQHGLAWASAEQQVRRILTSRDIVRSRIDQKISPDDLAQEALADLRSGLPRFRYESRLQTWLFTVVANCVNRRYTADTRKGAAR